MNSRFSVLDDGGVRTENWPIAGPVVPVAPDGPLAVISAVIVAARRHRFKFMLWVLFCIGTAVAYAYTATPSYTATSTILLEPGQSAVAAPDQLTAAGFDASRAEGEFQVLRSERLLSKVFSSLKIADDPEFAPGAPGLIAGFRDMIGSLIGYVFGVAPGLSSSPQDQQQRTFENFAQRLSVRRIGQSYVAEISYTANDPNLARRVANAAASAYLWHSVAAKADAAANGAEFLQGRLDGLSAQARAAASAVAAGSLPEMPTPDANARVIGAALKPLAPSAPRKGLILALGAMVGLVGGFVGVALGQALDRRVRTPQDIVQRTGLPCLASLIDGDRWYRPTLHWASGRGVAAAEWPESGFAKGIRELRTSIQLAVTGRSPEFVVALIACAPEAGTSMISLQLARLIRDGGHPVTLIDGDVHGAGSWPSIGSYPEESKCFAELLLDGESIYSSDILEDGGIGMIPGKSPDPDTNERAYLGAPALKQVLDHLRKKGSVILDLPPLATAAEARAATRQVDAVVLVARANLTTIDQLTGAATVLRSVGANVVGVVLNRA